MDPRQDQVYTPPTPLAPAVRRELWGRLFIRLLILLGLAAGLLLAGRPVLSLCMPFVLALVLTWLTEPLMGFLHRRCRLPRGAVSFLLILLVVGALGGILTAIVWKGWQEVSDLWANWDQVWNTFQSTYYAIGHAMEKWLAYLPQQVQDTFWGLSDRLLAWLQDFAYSLVPKTTSAARSISSFVLGFLFFLIAWYFTASDYPGLRRAARARIPKSVRLVGLQVRGAFSAAFGGYLKAEALVSIGVMGILLVGFLVIGQPYWLVLSILLGILDFIPIIGAGTVMVPWAAVLLILGDWRGALEMLVIWGVICLFRRLVEPKIVGNQTGLHPLLSLLAIYVGMRLGGVAAMILAPVLLLMMRNLWRAGMFRATFRDVSRAAEDMWAVLHREPGEDVHTSEGSVENSGEVQNFPEES